MNTTFAKDIFHLEDRLYITRELIMRTPFKMHCNNLELLTFFFEYKKLLIIQVKSVVSRKWEWSLGHLLFAWFRLPCFPLPCLSAEGKCWEFNIQVFSWFIIDLTLHSNVFEDLSEFSKEIMNRSMSQFVHGNINRNLGLIKFVLKFNGTQVQNNSNFEMLHISIFRPDFWRWH